MSLCDMIFITLWVGVNSNISDSLPLVEGATPLPAYLLYSKRVN